MNENTSTLSCNAIHPNGCLCTLEASHDGPHKAFGIPGQPPYVTWPNDHQPPPPGASCGVCLPIGSEYCDDEHNGDLCTRPPGHAGPHIACGVTAHHISLWPNTAPPPPTEDEWAASMRYADEHAGGRNASSNTLENIIDAIVEHDRLHPDHGVGCACHDLHAGAIRRLVNERTEGRVKSKRNLLVVLGYVTSNP